MTYVTCPIKSYQPAVVAQKAATVDLLSDGRFTLGLGAGENLNEHVTGGGWPPVNVLAEAVEIIRGLRTGSYVNFDGRNFQVYSAKVWDLQGQLPKLAIAATGEQSCQLAGQRVDVEALDELVGIAVQVVAGRVEKCPGYGQRSAQFVRGVGREKRPLFGAVCQGSSSTMSTRTSS
jgi:G6PDH family F420-dependent oxidoreductase